MSSLNKVFLIGNLTRDPELKFTPQGTAVCKLGLAVNREWKDSSGDKKKETNFFTVVIWGAAGENCGKFLAKGRPVLVEGRLATRTYETQDKQKRTVTEIVAERVQFLGSKQDRPDASADDRERDTRAEQETELPPAGPDDSIPF